MIKKNKVHRELEYSSKKNTEGKNSVASNKFFLNLNSCMWHVLAIYWELGVSMFHICHLEVKACLALPSLNIADTCSCVRQTKVLLVTHSYWKNVMEMSGIKKKATWSTQCGKTGFLTTAAGMGLMTSTPSTFNNNDVKSDIRTGEGKTS